MVVVIMGVSGSGKTTVGAALAAAVGGRFVDADDFHSAANVAKMRSGVPLTEDDREPWLTALRAEIDAALERDGIMVLACSALTRRSRERLGLSRRGIRLVFLNGERELLAQRLLGRAHFMPASLLDSQLATLEPPAAGEALGLNVRASPADLVAVVRKWLDR